MDLLSGILARRFADRFTPSLIEFLLYSFVCLYTYVFLFTSDDCYHHSKEKRWLECQAHIIFGTHEQTLEIQGRLRGWTSSPTRPGPPWHDSIGEDFDLGGLTVAVSNPDSTENEG